MTSNTARLDRYKLQSELTDDSATHCMIQSDLGTGCRWIEVLTTWRCGRELVGGGLEKFPYSERRDLANCRL